MDNTISKKSLIKHFTLLFSTIMLGVLFSSCENNNEEPLPKMVNSLSNYEQFGKIHNDFLDIALRFNQSSNSRVIGDDDAIPNNDALHKEVIFNTGFDK